MKKIISDNNSCEITIRDALRAIDNKTIFIRKLYDDEFEILTRRDGYKKGPYVWLCLNNLSYESNSRGGNSCHTIEEALLNSLENRYDTYIAYNTIDLIEILKT